MSIIEKEIIHTTKAALPGGAYSQAVKAKGFVFVSGTVGVDPESEKLVEPGNMIAQTKQTFNNLEAVLEASGSSLENVVKVTAYIDDLDSFDDFNETYSSYFKELPARSTVEVGRLPKGMTVEIDVIAVAD